MLGRGVVRGNNLPDGSPTFPSPAYGTADLYARLVQMHQKNRWFLNELLQKRDGLVS